MEKINVKLINYFDVWAGEEKGTWEVNNLCEECQFELNEDFTNRDLLQKLKEVGFLKNHVRMNMIEFEDLHEFGIEFSRKVNGYPIGRIEFIN